LFLSEKYTMRNQGKQKRAILVFNIQYVGYV